MTRGNTSWRPPGWGIRDAHADQFGRTSSFTESDELIAEFAASVLLDDLKTCASFMTPEQMKCIGLMIEGQIKYIAPDGEYRSGWLAFIPNEEEGVHANVS